MVVLLEQNSSTNIFLHLFMKDWNRIKWMFAHDSLTDIYVLNTIKEDWIKLMAKFNKDYDFEFNYSQGVDKKVDIEYILKRLNGEHELDAKLVILYKGIDIYCFFFSIDEIEFDFDTRQIKDIQSFEDIVEFMKEVSKILDKEVIMTPESFKEHILVSVYLDKVSIVGKPRGSR